MNRECFEYSCQRYDNPLVKEIRLLHMHPDNDDKGDCCEVIFIDGSSVIHKLNNSSVYTSQYGVPLSADGSVMYVSDWYHGLTAYDTRSGNQLWRIKKSHIRMTQLFSDFGVTVQYGKALIQFDCKSGEILNTIDSRQIEDMFYLSGLANGLGEREGDCRSGGIWLRSDCQYSENRKPSELPA